MTSARPSLPRQCLLVTRVTHEASGVVSVELRHPDGADLAPWEPGAHLDLHLPSGLIRQYSLCGDPADRQSYRVAVLREEGGRGGSLEIHDTGLVGRELTVVGPRNHFPLGAAKNCLLIAGGIGVTPLLAMARELDRQGRPWSMVYGGRSRSSMAFVDELLALSGPVDLTPQDERGLPDLSTAIGSCPAGTTVYCCGPEPLLQAVSALCATHLGPDALHIERFAAAGKLEPAPDASPGGGPAGADHPAGSDGEFEIELARSGRVLRVPPDRSVLEAVLEVLPGTPYSCEDGFCGTCETPVLEGMPDHRDTVLTDAEQETNKTMLICVSRAKSARLVLDL